MKMTDFAKYLTEYFGKYLPIECGASTNTINAYSTTFTLLIRYMGICRSVSPDYIKMSDFSRELIDDFLIWIEKDRKCNSSTRNARLAAIHSFFRFVQLKDVKGLATWQSILSIKVKKSRSKEMPYLTIDGIKLILNQPDLSTKYGRRDFTLLGLLYDSAMRVQELINITPSDIRFDGSTTTIKVLGKGQKVRLIPLSTAQTKNLRQYMTEIGLFEPSNLQKPIFHNMQGLHLTRTAILNIVKKHTSQARQINPMLIPENITCHSFRHSKAVHMLEADINLVYIRDFLGHTSVTTTEIYARVSSKMKHDALRKLNPGIIKTGKTSWQKNKVLLSYLKDLQSQH